MIQCSACGYENEDGLNFCDECGASLKRDEEATKGPAEPTAVPPGPPTPAPTETVPAGPAVPLPTEPVTTAPPEPPGTGLIKCQACGYEKNKPDAKFCLDCGVPLGTPAGPQGVVPPPVTPPPAVTAPPPVVAMPPVVVPEPVVTAPPPVVTPTVVPEPEPKPVVPEPQPVVAEPQPVVAEPQPVPPPPALKPPWPGAGLIAVRGDKQKKWYKVYERDEELGDDGRTVIGRMGERHVNIDLEEQEASSEELTVSRQHAIIVHNDRTNQYVIEDLGSSQGTYVGGEILKPGQPRVLWNGDFIDFGRVRLRFVCPE